MKAQDSIHIKNFLKNVTGHNPETAKIRRSPSKNWTYVVRVQGKNSQEHKVNFYFWNEGSERFLAYGISGWGVCTVANVKEIKS